MNRYRAVPLLLSAATALVGIAVWLTLDNPEIDGASRGDTYTCLAPWDTVLNDADNIPGGEPAPDGEEIGERCRELGHQRFAWAVASGLSAVALSLLPAALVWRRSRAGTRSLSRQR